MKNFNRLMFMVILSGFVLLVSNVVYHEIYVVSKERRSYINNISDVRIIYQDDKVFEDDLEKLEFVLVGDNVYERAVDKYLCEQVILSDEVIYQILDSCYSRVVNDVVVDFDGDGKSIYYSVSSVNDIALLNIYNYNLVSIASFDNDKIEIGSNGLNIDFETYFYLYDKSYERFINSLNALRY